MINEILNKLLRKEIEMPDTLKQISEEGMRMNRKIVYVFVDKDIKGNTRIMAIRNLDNDNSEVIYSFEGSIKDENYISMIIERLTKYHDKLVYEYKNLLEKLYKELAKISSNYFGKNIDIFVQLGEAYYVPILSIQPYNIAIVMYVVKIISNDGSLIEEIVLDPMVMINIVDRVVSMFSVLEEDFNNLVEEIKKWSS